MHYPARPPRFLRRPSGLQRASVSLIPPVLELLGPVSARWSLHEVGIGSYTPSEPGSSHTGLILQHSKLLEWSARPPAPAAATSLPCLTRQRTPGRSALALLRPNALFPRSVRGLGRASSLQDRGSLCSHRPRRLLAVRQKWQHRSARQLGINLGLQLERSQVLLAHVCWVVLAAGRLNCPATCRPV
jgi:hypothetical protein